MEHWPEAGFQVVAPDQRGYGQTGAPQAIESYNIFNLTGDIVGLVNYLGATSAIVIGPSLVVSTTLTVAGAGV